MIRTNLFCRLAIAGVLTLFPAAFSHAAAVSWSVDTAQSYLRLAMPTQAVKLNGTPSGNASIRNQGSSSATWNSGTTAAISGSVATNYDGSSIEFLAGQSSLGALNSGSYTPNPANWNSGTSKFSPADATAPAAFGGQLSLSQLGITLIFVTDAERFAISDVEYDVSSAPLAITAGQFSANQTSFEMSDAQVGLRGNAGFGFPSFLGTADAAGVEVGGANSSLLGTISVPDINQPNHLQLTLPVSVAFTMNLFNGSVSKLTGSAQGVIVAYAVVPEPHTLTLCAAGLAMLAFAAVRRRI